MKLCHLRSLPTRWGCCLLFGIVLLTSCARKPVPPIRIGLNPWPGYELVSLAERKGFFDQEGVPVRLVEFSSLGDARRAFERRQTDVLLGTLVEVLVAREQSDRNPQVFLVTDFSDGADAIVARAGIAGPANLRGKRIATEPATLNAYVLARGLGKAGLQFDDVRMVPMDQMAMEEAFARGEIDAAVTYPPVSINLLKKGAHPIFTSHEIPGEVADIAAIDGDFLNARRGDVQGIVRAYGRAQEYAAAHPEEADAIMAERERLSPAEFRKALEGVHLVTPDQQAPFFQPGGILERAAQVTDEVLHRTGQLTGAKGIQGLLAPWEARVAGRP